MTMGVNNLTETQSLHPIAPANGANTDEALPKLSPADYQIYNTLAEGMEEYHNHFRRTWTTIQDATTTGKRPHGMSLRTFIRTGINLCRGIIAHHRFEEAHIYPILAQRIPLFAEHESLLQQHKEIHEGLVKMERYLKLCDLGERELRMAELRETMDSFGGVLWEHLDEEVRDLRPDVMRRYYSTAEFQRIWGRFG